MKLFFIALLLSTLSATAQSAFDTKIAEAAKRLICPRPDQRNPVTLNAQLVSAGDSLAVMVKVSMSPGWHIYAYVPPEQPYIPIDQILQFPENIKAVGQWKNTEPEASSTDLGVLIYEGEAVFIHKAVKLPAVKEGGIVKAGLYYQTCDLRQCLPPKEKIFELKVN